ncbi:AraC family transcriptional regulator [Oceanispirochaeta sp.]|jgi:AraC-like DNA-binding protein|uniref:helix-turn-helix domain-containing protein n=1 Tax=Oceanispirochaeta sp. TaxID=2035350 RepID=UPI0026250E2A|nr:helix-turn-helix domain-containing protein [Oceanispirochaeta sp.]MDA3955448.1 helix-turn-helix domain-containing protein [Oceanispirochaeta sp.]
MTGLTFVASLGAIQGVMLLLSILFRFRHKKNLALALLLLVFSVRLVTIPTWNPDILLSYPVLFPLTTPLPFLFAPLLWWYIRELCSDTLATPRPLILLFLPYLMETAAVTITLLSMAAVEYELFIHNVFSGNPPLWLPVRNGLKVLVNVCYMVAAGRIAFGKKSAILSSSRRLWLRSLIILPSVVLIFFASVAVFPGASEALAGGSPAPFMILAITMAGLIYGISILMLIVPDLIQVTLKSVTSEQVCSEKECEYLVQRLDNRLNEAAFRNPNLLLTDLAAEFKVHPNRLSYAINHSCHTSFRTLLNSRRLEYFLEQIVQGALKKQSILDLAFESGFPSKTTFNRVFKEQMEMSPSEYMRELKSS